MRHQRPPFSLRLVLVKSVGLVYRVSWSSAQFGQVALPDTLICVKCSEKRARV